MNIEIVNPISGYIETLNEINIKLIKICGTNIGCQTVSEYKKDTLDIIQNIPRLIPYTYSVKNDILKLQENDGLLEYSNEIKYLKEYYDDMLVKNNEILKKIKLVRNKYEHKMHEIVYKSSSSGSLSLFSIEFKLGKKNIKICAGELIKLLERLNILFDRILKYISAYAYENGMKDHPYLQYITKFQFTDFNEIYKSNLLRKIGRILNNF